VTAALAVVALVLAVALLVVAARARRLAVALARAERSAEEVADRDRTRARTEARLAGALSGLPHGVVIYDERGLLVFANEVAADYVMSRHAESLVEQAVAELAVEVAGSPADVPPTRSVDLFGPPRRTVLLQAAPLHVDDGAPGVLVVIEDVTDRRRLEAVRRDFVANISHELKTPVGALGLLAETLLAEDDPDVAHRLAERMQAEAFRVARTIDDLLALSQIEADEAGLRDEVPVHLFVAEAVDRVRPAAEQQGITIEVMEPDARLVVVGDRRQLVSATYNLLDNAVKYSDAGSSVQVRARTDGRWIDLSVADHGIGIPRRDLERVFERFYRVDRARSRETGGTGLGLAIVRHVAGNHDGDVKVESAEGEGSTFTLRLPVGAGPVAVTAEAG
jgi:two-component system sensor histidine kinase SenX3